MPVPTIDESFVRQYESEVHAAYQRQGSLLRNTVRTKNNIKGKSTTFQKVGKGEASQKTRNGDVELMNLDHTPVEVTLGDWYAGELVDRLDELKQNQDERAIVASAEAYALGRKTDELIIDALSGTTLTVGDYSTAFTNALAMQALEALYDNDVPDDGQIVGLLANHAWNEFKSFSKVSSRDYAGELFPWLKGRQAFMWNGVLWMPHSGLPLADTDNRDCFLYHKTAVGHASGADVSTDITWQGLKQAHFICSSMSQGAGLIDGGTDGGVVKIKVDDDTAIS